MNMFMEFEPSLDSNKPEARSTNLMVWAPDALERHASVREYNRHLFEYNAKATIGKHKAPHAEKLGCKRSLSSEGYQHWNCLYTMEQKGYV